MPFTLFERVGGIRRRKRDRSLARKLAHFMEFDSLAIFHEAKILSTQIFNSRNNQLRKTVGESENTIHDLEQEQTGNFKEYAE